MTISKNLFLAVTAMDAYNRGYGEGLDGLGGLGSALGSAILKTQSDVDPSTAGVSAGFYAVAYKTTSDIGSIDTGGVIPAGATIISYRGTDGLLLDVTLGWTIGASVIVPGGQAALASQFYTAATNGRSLSDGAAPDVILTGHSLGGGLAGLIAALTGRRCDRRRRDAMGLRGSRRDRRAAPRPASKSDLVSPSLG